MKQQMKITLLFLAAVGAAAVLATALVPGRGRAQQRPRGGPPVIDFAAPEPADAARKAKSERFKDRLPEPISPREDEGGALAITHWWEGMTALPAERSDAVVIGEVTDAQAHLAPGKTGVYTEFAVRLDTVLKGDGTLAPAASIITQREGGAVRFDNGRVKTYRVGGKRMPEVGGRYALFLKAQDAGRDFDIITGYELREGRVVPLDGIGRASGPGVLPFDRYVGADEATVLRDLQNATAGQSQGGR
jgi:hypothetical protein